MAEKTHKKEYKPNAKEIREIEMKRSQIERITQESKYKIFGA